VHRYRPLAYSHPEPETRSSGADIHSRESIAPGFVVSLNKQTASAVLKVLLTVELCFAIIHGVLQVYVAPTSPWVTLRDLFDLDLETSIPTWFSATQLAAISLLLVGQAAKRPDWRNPILLMGAVFMFLSIDEGASIHDSLYGLVRNQPTFGTAPFLAWMLPYSCMAIVLLRVLWKPILSARRRAPLETALVACGAVVFATGGGALEIASHYVLIITSERLPFIVSVMAEEFCEMVGVTIMLYALMLFSARTPSTPAPSRLP
jgi:hypothetical protein